MERKKLELPINQSLKLQLLFDEPLVGESKFGEYYMYAVKNGQDEFEYSFFAPLSVHERLKNKPKGTRFQISSRHLRLAPNEPHSNRNLGASPSTARPARLNLQAQLPLCE